MSSRADVDPLRSGVPGRNTLTGLRDSVRSAVDPERVRTRLIALAASLAGVVLLAGACDPLIDAPAGVAAPPSVDVPADSDPAASANSLASLAVVTWAPMSGYSRDRFKTWDAQGDGCDTRDVVLKRDGQGVSVGASCKIFQGSWFSAYDGRTVSDPQALDIDHMVPLANAWRTGAAAWTDEQREAFANDLTRPQLLAVTLSTNRSKGDQDPSEWKPPRREYWCAYAQRWIGVKGYWKLGVTVAEKSALTEMLGTCA
jgi:hypothetical protein